MRNEGLDGRIQGAALILVARVCDKVLDVILLQVAFEDSSEHVALVRGGLPWNARARFHDVLERVSGSFTRNATAHGIRE